MGIERKIEDAVASGVQQRWPEMSALAAEERYVLVADKTLRVLFYSAHLGASAPA